MQKTLQAITSELKRLKQEGVSHIYWDDDSLQALKERLPSPAPIQDIALPKSASPANKQIQSKAESTSQISVAPHFEIPEGDKKTQWNWLRERVLSCETCNAHLKPNKKVVFGVGSLNADIFFCGEAPGADEEVLGEPFVGKAGQLLTKIIGAMGFRRHEVYIGNIMNWRPEMPAAYGNRPPTQDEMNFCLPYLKAQLKIINPKVIVALGATAVNGLLGPDKNRRMGQTRGQWFSFENTPLMVTFHPSYLLRNNTNRSKRMVWEDMLKVMEKTGMAISEKQQSFFLG